MSEARTPEQVAADDALAQALHNALVARYPDSPGMVLDYVCLVQREDPEQPDVTQYYYLVPNGTLPWHRILGMIEVMRHLMAQSLAEDGA